MTSLYRRNLPSPPAIDFSSSEGKKLFTEAIQNGTMENFFKLISSFQTQSEPAYCGLASLSMVLNALSIDPGRKWKGPWRWFDENMFDCCEPLERVKDKGISFGKVVCLAYCGGANVKAFRTSQSSIHDFRKYVVACSSSDDCHVISSYHRGTFDQTGTGHFSPIGGYHAERDMALILDVARFKYPPHWVPLGLLWEAMETIDESTGQHRGFMLVSNHQRAPALLYSLGCNHESWSNTAKYLMDDVPVLLTSETLKDVESMLSTVFASLPSIFAEFIKWVEEIHRKETCSQGLSREEKQRLVIKKELLKQVQETDLYKHITRILSSGKTVLRAKQTSDQYVGLRNIAESVRCQVDGILTRDCGLPDRISCQERRYKATDNDKVASGVAISGTVERGINKLFPSLGEPSCSSIDLFVYSGTHPDSPINDVLVVLLFALPPDTWSGIKDKRLLEEISCLVSIDNLPSLLQEEVLKLRAQLLMAKICRDDKLEKDLDFKSSLLDEAIFLQLSNFYSKNNSNLKKSHLIHASSVKTPLLPHHGVFSLGVSSYNRHHSLSGASWDGIRQMISCPNSALYKRHSLWARHPYVVT